MKSGKAIIIKGLSKEYYKKDSSTSGFFDKLRPNKSGQSFFALKDINLEINRGEVIGIIGSNGAGKSTLLKILAEVTPPTSGSVEVFGKVASILEIGIGFQPELSGYENIFLSGKLYGLTKKQIISKLDKIIEMFGFPDFINTEVKHYSSGMYMRLAFSIIINIEADIYLFDEILSVGDSVFQGRALKEIEKLRETSATICIVTHTPKIIYHLCDRMILLDKGSLIFNEDPNSTIIEYQKASSLKQSEVISKNNFVDVNTLSNLKRCFIDLNGASFDLLNFKIYNPDHNEEKICGDKEITVELNFSYISSQDFRLILLIQDQYGTAIVTHFAEIEKSQVKNDVNLLMIFPENSLNASRFVFDVLISDTNNKIIIGYRNITKVDITNDTNKISRFMGYVNIPVKNIVSVNKNKNGNTI